MSDSSTPEMVTIEVDGQELQGPAGAMLIELTDKACIDIPRFCYHDKLTIAANCRMCLVEVEKVPKPLPACATPIMEGMKVFTKSDKARMAQKGTMEFLLVNHPLDCPICDQGGECELQDLALGYGRDISRFSENKRVVADKDIGPLVATDMTRCIHCTRCVRFSEEIAGIRELGATGRGENTEIGIYIEGSMQSELSGNIIDLCPVGALTSKPFRFTARAWELVQQPSIAPHDSVGSNILVHARGSQIMRVVPDRNESINEVWISDRDRFSYEGIGSDDRLTTPRIKTNGVWHDVEWQVALQAVADGLRTTSADQLAAITSPTSTLEELYLAQKLMRALGSSNIDHRLRLGDVRDQDSAPAFPGLGCSIADLESLDAALVIGSNIRKDQPILAHRLRKASNAGAELHFINPVDFDFVFSVANRLIIGPAGMVGATAAVAAALLEANGKSVPADIRNLCTASEVDQGAKAIAGSLQQAPRSMVFLGAIAESHPDYSVLRSLACTIASECGGQCGYLPQSANSVGACLAGAQPHRGVGASTVSDSGRGLAALVEGGMSGCVLLGVEPEADCDDPAHVIAALEDCGFVVSMHAFTTETLEQVADVMLPIAAFGETSGTFVNAEGTWQSFSGVVPPRGDARPAWKVLRVLGNVLDLEGFEYESSEQVRDELHRACEGVGTDTSQHGNCYTTALDVGLMRVADVPIYSTDALVRRSPALQKTGDAASFLARISHAQAAQLGLSDGESVSVVQGDARQVCTVVTDTRVPESTVWLSCGTAKAAMLGASIGPVSLEKGSGEGML